MTSHNMFWFVRKVFLSVPCNQLLFAVSRNKHRVGENHAVQIRLEEGALFLSRNGLGSTGVVLKLEATHGYGRDCLLALHTLVLSYNQVQVCRGTEELYSQFEVGSLVTDGVITTVVLT